MSRFYGDRLTRAETRALAVMETRLSLDSPELSRAVLEFTRIRRRRVVTQLGRLGMSLVLLIAFAVLVTPEIQHFISSFATAAARARP